MILKIHLFSYRSLNPSPVANTIVLRLRQPPTSKLTGKGLNLVFFIITIYIIIYYTLGHKIECNYFCTNTLAI